jgi:hypothetical protein
LPPEDADAQRDLLAGFRWIFVDEYQDIGPAQYALISALAGRKRSDEDGRLNLFAVGDDARTSTPSPAPQSNSSASLPTTTRRKPASWSRTTGRPPTSSLPPTP